MGIFYKTFEKACYKGIHKSNKLGMKLLREEVAEENISKEYFNSLVYGTNDKQEIRKKRKNIW